MCSFHCLHDILHAANDVVPAAGPLPTPLKFHLREPLSARPAFDPEGNGGGGAIFGNGAPLPNPQNVRHPVSPGPVFPRAPVHEPLRLERHAHRCDWLHANKTPAWVLRLEVFQDRQDDFALLRRVEFELHSSTTSATPRSSTCRSPAVMARSSIC